MTIVALEVRKTHKYVGTYAHLDDWDYIGSAKIIASSYVHGDEEDPCDPVTGALMICVEVEEGSPSRDEVHQAIVSSFTRGGCHHEYDCCGCRSTYATDVKNVHGRVWTFTTHSSRNY